MANLCINPLCNYRINSDDQDRCQNCGSSLLFQSRYFLKEILREPHQGSASLIYKGFDIQDNISVFIKCVNWSIENNSGNLRREYDFLRQVTKPFQENRLSVDSYFEITINPDIEGLNAAFLVLPWSDGQDTEKWISMNGIIDENMVVQWIVQLLPFLECLEERGYIHRDIKPSNIMLINDQLKLIDYGFVRRLDETYLSRITAKAYNRTRGNFESLTRVVSSGYTAPEQVQGFALPQSDFFALGRTIVYWITGENPNEIIGFKNSSPVWEAFPELSSTLTSYLDRLLDPRPEKRPLKVSNIRYFFEEVYPKKLATEKRAKSKLSRFRRYTLITLLGLGSIALILFGISRWQNYQGTQALLAENYPKAQKLFQGSLKIDPLYWKAWQNLSIACQAQEDLKCAIHSLEKAIELQPNDSLTYFQIGFLKEQQQDLDSAMKFYSLALSKNPMNFLAINRLARIEILQKDYKSAENLIQPALQYNSDKNSQAELLKNLGWIRLNQGKLTDAKNILKKSIQLDDTQADPFCLLAQANEKLNLLSESRANWRACVQIDSDKPEIQAWQNLILDQIQFPPK